MKYVRTKDKIEKVPNDYASKIVECPNLKIADTIEELCDSEVIVWKDSTPSTWNKFLTKQEFERLYSSFQRKKIIAIYGAIWTDNGLIYVAQLNDKGELELL